MESPNRPIVTNWQTQTLNPISETLNPKPPWQQEERPLERNVLVKRDAGPALPRHAAGCLDVAGFGFLGFRVI